MCTFFLCGKKKIHLFGTSKKLESFFTTKEESTRRTTKVYLEASQDCYGWHGRDRGPVNNQHFFCDIE